MYVYFVRLTSYQLNTLYPQQIIQGLIQEQVYTQIFLNCRFLSFKFHAKTRPNERFVCILALVSVLV